MFLSIIFQKRYQNMSWSISPPKIAANAVWEETKMGNEQMVGGFNITSRDLEIDKPYFVRTTGTKFVKSKKGNNVRFLVVVGSFAPDSSKLEVEIPCFKIRSATVFNSEIPDDFVMTKQKDETYFFKPQ